MCAKGITIDNYEKHCLEPLDFYNELVAIVANGDTFAERLIERLTELCPRDDDECDKIAADDPTLGSAEFQANLFAILDQKGARNNTITNQWLLRVAVKCNRNCFREAGLFPIASKFNHSCYPSCVAYFHHIVHLEQYPTFNIGKEKVPTKKVAMSSAPLMPVQFVRSSSRNNGCSHNMARPVADIVGKFFGVNVRI